MDRTKIDRRWIIGVTQPAAFLVFAMGAWLAWQHFPAPFDWRRMMISELLSPRDNPRGFVWIACGIALSGVLLLPLGTYLHGVLLRVSRRAAQSVRGLVATGGCSMGAIAAITDIPPALRLHNPLALLIFGALLTGLVTTAALLVRHPETTWLRQSNRFWLRLLLALLVIPIVATLGTQLAAVVLHWRDAARSGPEWLNVAFWEWILAGLIYGGGWILAWLTTERRAARGSQQPPLL